MLIASFSVHIFMILRSFTIIVECIWCGRSINYLNVYAMYFIAMSLQLHSLHFLAKNRINNAQDYVACNKARVHNISILFPWCFIFITWRRTNIFSIILIEIFKKSYRSGHSLQCKSSETKDDSCKDVFFYLYESILYIRSYRWIFNEHDFIIILYNP